ncbi:RodZ domain-containing protein [Calditrichota bacterium]
MKAESLSENKKKFLEDIKNARKSKDLELVRISERSKIALSYLEKIEDGDWEFLPITYVRSFIKTHCQYTDLKTDEILKRFDDIVGETSQKSQQSTYEDSQAVVHGDSIRGTSLGTIQSLQRTSSPTKPSYQLTKGNTIYWIAGAIIAIISLIIIFSISKGDKKDKVAEIPFDKIVEEQEGRSIQSKVDSGIVSEPVKTNETVLPGRNEFVALEKPKQNKLTLKALANDECYIRVTADILENVIDDVVLIKGFERIYEADSLLIVVLGNAGAMSLILNGEDLGTLGEMGRVVTITLGPDGLRKLRRGVLNKRAVEKDTTDTADSSENNSEETSLDNNVNSNTSSESMNLNISPGDTTQNE